MLEVEGGLDGPPLYLAKDGGLSSRQTLGDDLGQKIGPPAGSEDGHAQVVDQKVGNQLMVLKTGLETGIAPVGAGMLAGP